MTDYLATLEHSGVRSHNIKLRNWEYTSCQLEKRTCRLSYRMGPKFLLQPSCPTLCKFVLLKDKTADWIQRITVSFVTWQGVDVTQARFPIRLCLAVTVHRSQQHESSLICAGASLCTAASMSRYYL